MLKYIGRRLGLMIITLFAISILSFILIQLPPGDYLTSYVADLMAQGETLESEAIEALRLRYGLGEPLHVQYYRWMNGIFHGDLGRSLEWSRPVAALIKDRLPWSFSVSLLSFIFVWILALPIGVYSATHQYSPLDYVASFVGFVGVAVPNFMIALLALWAYFHARGTVIVGLFSEQYAMAPWSFAKLVDLLKHLWIPALILGTAGTAGTIRAIRANMLDELSKPYVMMARAKGVSERRLLLKYPLRVALIPTAATIGGILPSLFGGELIVSTVLGIPTLGPILFKAVRSQDMFLAGSIVLIISSLSVLGNLLSDILVGIVDPRIRGAV